ncbi:hypothetical protein [Simiduia aestuariiviva]|uniref:Uncharacterized protein n=1 Tax=Simiduia aestuariiviva TaxID=1510459 RepID=A0A839UR66_9GAMM|nr:hypothetical protein [Simiduia aestuariiviva]MBB3168356.1 hypothetical protein [Simiduia aestuariiviva]
MKLTLLFILITIIASACSKSEINSNKNQVSVAPSTQTIKLPLKKIKANRAIKNLQISKSEISGTVKNRRANLTFTKPLIKNPGTYRFSMNVNQKSPSRVTVYYKKIGAGTKYLKENSKSFTINKTTTTYASFDFVIDEVPATLLIRPATKPSEFKLSNIKLIQLTTSQ